MTENSPRTPARALPTWGDWLLPAATSVLAIVILAALFGWWSVEEAGKTAHLNERARLLSLGRVIAAHAEQEGLTGQELDGFLDNVKTISGVATLERLDSVITPQNTSRSVADVVVPMAEGAVRLINPVKPPPALSAMLLPGAVAGGLILLVASVAVSASKRTAALRRVGSALRAIQTGESDREVLLVSDRFGPDALAWNELLAARGETLESSSAAQPDRRDNSSQAGVLPMSALDAMPIGLMAFAEDGVLLFCNGAASTMLGLNRTEAMGRALIEEESFAEIAPSFRKVAGGGTPRMTAEISRGEGLRRDVLRVTVRSLRREDDATLMVLLEDITQQRIADEARNGFVAQATHELRAPLTNIRLLAEEAIEIGVAEPATLARSLNVVNQEARRLDRVVADMLSVSEIEAASLTLQINDVPLKKLFSDLEMDYTAQASEKSIDLKFDLPSKLETIQADREKLALLLHNVVGNAIKYTPEGGSVVLSAEVENSWLTVRVKDTGPGIAPEDHERVFQKFFRTDQARMSDVKGTGLGLALAREIARRHGGDVLLESELGRGSTFTVRIPGGIAGAMSKAA